MRTMTALVSLFVAAIPVVAQDQQLGARTKAMGGSYTAFEDDPVSVWLNPAGIATQSDQLATEYQTYTTYEIDLSGSGASILGEAESNWVDPAIVPSYAGFVFQLGTPEAPMALGVCYARPYHLKYVMDEFEGAGPTNSDVGANTMVEQSFSRFRVALARDFRFRKAGEAGFLPHLALGIGIDLGYERWEFFKRTVQTLPPPLSTSIVTITNVNDNATSIGAGVGLLLGIYDNAESFKLNLGIAYQSPVRYSFNLNRQEYPQFHMPQQLNAGLTVYLLEGMPLRLTVDGQWIDWDRTAAEPNLSNQPGFDDAYNLSFGAEYRIRLSDKVDLLPRLGYRRFEAPWKNPGDLPMTSKYKLALQTDSAAFHVITFGLGVAWSTASNKIRTVDVAGDWGGDSANLAIGMTFEF